MDTCSMKNWKVRREYMKEKYIFKIDLDNYIKEPHFKSDCGLIGALAL